MTAQQIAVDMRREFERKSKEIARLKEELAKLERERLTIRHALNALDGKAYNQARGRAA